MREQRTLADPRSGPPPNICRQLTLARQLSMPGAQDDGAVLRRSERQRDTRIPFDVADLGMPAQVTADDVVAVQSDPDDRYLWAAVGG